MTEPDPFKGLSPWLANLMTPDNYNVVWCPIHLLPYERQWPLGAAWATVNLVEEAAEMVGGDPSYLMMCKLVELSPLCCQINPVRLNEIHRRTVPK